jgi:hypothetical protein
MPVEADRPPSGSATWWHRPFSVFQTNLQEIDATLDVGAALDLIEDYGADTWLLNTGGIVSFHPSDLPFQSPSPYLADRPSGDLVGDAVRAAHQRGIKVIGRLDFSKVSSRVAREHPDWLYRSPEGEPQLYNTLYSVCPSGDYYQHRTIDVLDEIMDRYPVDGFFFNWFSFNERDYSRRYRGVCHCASCRERYAAHSDGGALPTGPDSDDYWSWLRFCSETIGELTRRITDHIADRRPDVALVLRRGASVAYQEANNAFGADVWHHATAEAVSAHVVASPDVPVMVNSVSFVDMPYRMAGEQPERFEQYLLQAIARGGNPSTYIMGAPGRVPYASLAAGREITRFHRRNTAIYDGLRPAATTAVVRPNRFGMRPHLYARTVEEYRGVYASLQQTHHPFDVLAVESLVDMGRSDRLDRFSVLVLPDLGPLGPDVASVLDDFVDGGGHVLVTGTSGVAEDGTVELASSPARTRAGEPAADEEVWSSYATLDDQPGVDDYRYSPSVVPVYGTCSSFVWKPGVTKVGGVLRPAPYGPPEKCYGHTLGPDPAMVTLSRGSGGGVTVIPWTIGRTYREFGTTEVRAVLLRALAPVVEPLVTTSLPEHVELILGRDGDGGYVLHLLNLSGARHRTFGPHLTIHGGQVRLHGVDASSAEALLSGEPLCLRHEDADVVLDLPPLELFEVVRVAARASADMTTPLEGT